MYVHIVSLSHLYLVGFPGPDLLEQVVIKSCLVRDFKDAVRRSKTMHFTTNAFFRLI